jgi:hypothetical protein
MGGRGSSRGGTGGGTHITVPEGKRRRGSGNRRKKIKVDQPGFPIGTNPPRPPTGGPQGNEEAQ